MRLAGSGHQTPSAFYLIHTDGGSAGAHQSRQRILTIYVSRQFASMLSGCQGMRRCSLHCQTANVNRHTYRSFARRREVQEISRYRPVRHSRGVRHRPSPSASWRASSQRWPAALARSRSSAITLVEPAIGSPGGGAGEGRGDEATQYGPVALEVAVTILQTAHHHIREVAQPQVEVRPGSPGGSSLLAIAASR
jgi:hypothetical protein